MKKRNLLVRVIIIAIVTLLGIWAVFMPRRVPNAQDFTWNGIKQNLSENIKLGLDLKGGSRLVMRVEVEKFLEELTKNNALAIETEAKKANLPVTKAQPVTDTARGNYQIIVESSDPAKLGEIRDNIQKNLPLADWTQSQSGNQLVYTLPQTIQQTLGTQAVEQARAIIDSRINKLGVTEPELSTHGAASSHQLLLQLPGLQDPERAKKLLTVESKLELMRVISPKSPAPMQTYPTQEAAQASLGGASPSNRRILPYVERDDTDTANQNQNQAGNNIRGYVVVENPAIVDGSELRDAQPVSRSGSDDDYQIAFQLKPAGAQKFGAWTGANVGEYMAVVLNGEVKSAPYIKSQIFDSGEISGRFTRQTAEDLALTLRSGALPAPISYIEERTVGPSLGADSIRAGVTASVAGLIFVLLFMVIYYKGSGVNAVIALLLNMLLTIAALVAFGAVLTLPGIAGLILGIGMAVDSNVLIFERIREELRAGKLVGQAVDLGFDRAFITIIDTHVTTIIAALLLFIFGTGPIRGFAVTLILGLLINLFSAVYVSRTIFIWLLSRKKQVQSLSI